MNNKEYSLGKKMSQYINNFKKYQPLLGELVGRDIKIKYRRSVLGVLWSLLNPLLMTIVLSVVFSNLFKFEIENFPLYILSGQLIFNFFNESTTNAMSAIISNSSLIKKIYVPKYLFVLSRTVSSLINLLASSTALLIVTVVMRVELHWTMLLIPIPLIIVVIFSLGVSFILSAIAVKFRDIMHFYSVFTTALMYLTPVIYPMSILPEGMSFIVRLNPLTNILIMFRDVYMNNMLFDPFDLLLGVVEAIVVLAIGLWVFYKKQDEFILYI